MVKIESMDSAALSALIDGEFKEDKTPLTQAEASQVVNAILADDNLIKTWHEYYTIRDCLSTLYAEFINDLPDLGEIFE